MRISVSVAASDVQVSQDFIPLEVFPDMTLDAVKGFIQDEIQVAPSAQLFMLNGQPISNTSQTLTELGVNEGDVLSLVIRTAPQSQQPQRPPTQQRREAPTDAVHNAERTRLQILNNQGMLAEVRQRDPGLAAALNDPERFRELYEERTRQLEDNQRQKEEMMTLLDADPFNADAQTKIEEIIRQERVMENMQKALEDNPESFGRVVMLYIDVTVNNTPIKAFVDSGAQTTIMSPDAADKCGIMRLIDRRYGGIARGVGTAKILGRVHSADIQIGQYSLASSFTVMEGKGVDLLLGLDMLKRHQMCIDLKDNVLRIQDDAVPFLSENETPKAFEEAMEEEETVKGPGGTEIGATTGTVRPAGDSSSSQSAPQTSTPSSSGIRIHPQGSAGNIYTSQPSSSSQPQPQSQRAQGTTSSLPPGVTEQGISQILFMLINYN